MTESAHLRTEVSAPAGDEKMASIFVGRQPIFDRELRVVAYELLYRAGETNQAGVVSGETATAEVIISSFLDIGLDRLVEDRLAFINFTRDLIVSEDILSLPSGRVVIEILEDVEVDPTLVEAVSDLSRSGFTIALDDFVYQPELRPLVELADIIKIDVMALPPAEVEAHVPHLKQLGVRLLAEKVESRAELEWLLSLGFDYFQGYFFARPLVVSGKRLNGGSLAVVRLLAALHDVSISAQDLETLISRDVALSFKLVRFINSAYFGLPGQITSIRKAIIFLGLDTLKRWVSLMVLANVRNKPSELFRCALTRARMCELLATATMQVTQSVAFTAGLFSILDALLDRPLVEVLDELSLSVDLRLAILDGGGAIGELLCCALAYENGRGEEATLPGVTEDIVREIYWESVAWSCEVSRGLHSD